MPKEKEYATIQIDKSIKAQIVELCNREGLKIGRFMEKLFQDAMSGSIKH